MKGAAPAPSSPIAAISGPCRQPNPMASAETATNPASATSGPTSPYNCRAASTAANSVTTPAAENTEGR